MAKRAVKERNQPSTGVVVAATNYWEIGLQSFKDGDSAIQGIQKIWDSMAPPANLSLLAKIVGALWADVYWANTRMSISQLAADITAAIGISPGDAHKAATGAFERWYGLQVRGNFADNGSIPKSDPVTSSPDVVVNGAAELSVKQLVQQWNVYIYTPQPGLKNNTYGRAQSYGIEVPITKPVLRMYYSDAGFTPPPSTWVKLFTFDGSSETAPLYTQQGETTIEPGERSANALSFAFNPPGSGHYCLITVAGTEFFTNNPSTQSGNWSTQEWVHYNGAAGWHNVDVSTTNKATLKFYNQDGRVERFSFEAHCGRLPAGTEVSLECRDKGLVHPIQARRTITGAYEIVTAEGEVPPNFTGDLQVRFKTPGGKPLPANAFVDVRKFWHLPPGHAHYLQGIEQLGDSQPLALQQTIRIPMGNFAFIGPQ